MSSDDKNVVDLPTELPEPSRNADSHRQCFKLTPAFREMIEASLNH